MPKVVVATQTRVVEAAVDPTGEWIPSTPVVSVHADPDELCGWLATATTLDRPHVEEHREIMEAVLARDAERAVALLDRHYGLTTQAILTHSGAHEPA